MKHGVTSNSYINRTLLRPVSNKPEVQREARAKVTQREAPLICNREFNKLVREAVDEGLSSLGDSQKQMIYLVLEKTFEIKKSEIPDRIEEFAYMEFPQVERLRRAHELDPQDAVRVLQDLGVFHRRVHSH